ncbi:hypothetical protein MPTP_1186 [Melissococcus plutonius ATCC 35311]|uniref:Uncharacterized protein n=1 Tax=Melissococcus plutonius (strain ATCC 35311 / DSM 29964 / CIP 104052 / LMG 20360 / NCIMB 702443) TaxID=940190 RepID=F3YAV9_MELPT|nr:hypothetical protein MPTP_1186 [Melissococcus plutonius ATCC 35311]BAL62012.1 hypothetical protein MPD5_0769 [Melissococcus plutonius DAT561]
MKLFTKFLVSKMGLYEKFLISFIIAYLMTKKKHEMALKQPI